MNVRKETPAAACIAAAGTVSVALESALRHDESMQNKLANSLPLRRMHCGQRTPVSPNSLGVALDGSRVHRRHTVPAHSRPNCFSMSLRQMGALTFGPHATALLASQADSAGADSTGRKLMTVRLIPCTALGGDSLRTAPSIHYSTLYLDGSSAVSAVSALCP